MRRTTHLLLALGLALPSAVAAGPASSACRLPRVPSDAPGTEQCGLELVGAVDLSATGGTGQIAVHDDLVAVVQRDDGQVALVDVADPTAPVVLGRYDGGTGQASLDHPLDGDVAFSDDGTILLHARQTSDWSNEGLHVLDVTDPTNPVRTDLAPQGGMLRLTYGRVGDAEIVATLDATHGLTILELVRTPAGARVVPLHVDPLPALKVGGPASAGLHLDPADPITGNPVLYVSDGTTGLRLLDLSTPARPVELGAWDTQGLAEVAVDATSERRLVHAATEYWFDASTPPEVVILDATDPTAVVEVARHNLGDRDGDRAWKLGGMVLDDDGRLHVAHGHAGAITIDPASGQVLAVATDLGEPTSQRAYVGLGWFAMDVARVGDLTAVTDAVTGELRLFATT